MSHDIEDIIAVLDGRQKIIEEVKRADPNLKAALSYRFLELSRDAHFVDAVSGHMPTDLVSQARVSTILSKIEEISKV